MRESIMIDIDGARIRQATGPSGLGPNIVAGGEPLRVGGILVHDGDH